MVQEPYYYDTYRTTQSFYNYTVSSQIQQSTYEDKKKRTLRDRIADFLDYSKFFYIYAAINTLFASTGTVIFIMYMNEVDVVIPAWVWYVSLAVSIYYTFDFCLSFYLAANKWTFIFSEPGFIEVASSFPVLIVMIYMKLHDNVAAWIIKLPIFRIYILYSEY